MREVVVVILMLFFAEGVFGCTLSGKPLSNFDDTEYIFIGTVIGYTKPAQFDVRNATNSVEPISMTYMDGTSKPTTKTTGLIVKVNESVYLPKNGTEFEIYFFDLWADCSIGGVASNTLEDRFPINTEIRVIAKESIFLTDPPTGRIRLEDRPSESGQVVLNSDRYSKKLTSGTSQFEYKTYDFDVNKSYSYNSLPDFEIRKDLLRLKRATIQKERDLILDRLLDIPVNGYVDLHKIFYLYAVTESEAKRYYETYLKTKDPEAYEAYKVWEKAVDDLSKFGYQRGAIERAMEIAFKEGTFLGDKNFLQKCKEILAKDKQHQK